MEAKIAKKLKSEFEEKKNRIKTIKQKIKKNTQKNR